MQQLKYIFSSDYLFQTGLKTLTATDRFYWILALVLLALGFFSFIYKRKKPEITREFWQRWQNMSLTIAILALIWTGLRSQLIRGLSAHIIIWLVYLLAVIWSMMIIRYYFGSYRREMAEYNKQQQKMKYM